MESQLRSCLLDCWMSGEAAVAPTSSIKSPHRGDGSGNHKRVPAGAENPGACVLAAAEVYVGMTTEGADRPAFSAEHAAAELRWLASKGVLEPRATMPAGAGITEHRPSGLRSQGFCPSREKCEVPP